MVTYVKLLVILAVIGYAAWYLLVGSNRNVVNLKVNIADIGGDENVANQGAESKNSAAGKRGVVDV